MNYEEWFADAKKRIEALEAGDEFTAKGLFEGIKWDKLTVSNKRSFGRYFSSQLRIGKLPIAEQIGKDKSGQNLYKRI